MDLKEEFMKIDDPVRLLEAAKNAQFQGILDKEMIQHFNQVFKKHYSQTSLEHANPYSLARMRRNKRQ